MDIAKVECSVRLIQNGNTGLLTVSKAGPGAILVTEIPLLRRINDIEEGGADDCAVSDVRQVDVVKDVSRGAEIERLTSLYGRALVDQIYPGGRGLPSTVEDCELPDEAMGKAGKAKSKAA